MLRTLKISILLAIACCAGIRLPDADDDLSAADWKSLFSYGDDGLQFESADGNNFLWFGVRLQTRYSNEQVTDKELPGEPTTTESELKLNRGRFKLGGHLVSPDFEVYSEFDFPTDRLLDLRATYTFSDRFALRVGQWKPAFNRERRDSSGAQQFVERSIATPWFTIDRQQGVVASGRLASGSPLDSSYWVAYLSGAGRGGSWSDAEGLWMGRYQWNFTGNVLGFSQSDIDRRESPAGSVAVAHVRGDSRFTSFSSEGGGELPGFAATTDSGRYRLRQWLIETAWQHRGLSWQQELHLKLVRDRDSGIERRMFGGYAQFGAFLSRFWRAVPAPLELALRFAAVEPDDSFGDAFEREFTLAGNWFFDGHRNKLTADLSYLRKAQVPDTNSRIRIRLQWDWSF